MARHRAMSYVDSVLVVYGREALVPERKAAELLAHQLSKRAGVRCAVVDDQSYDPGGWQALILVGHSDRHLAAAAFMAGHGVRRPNDARPGPEGYVVRRVGRLRMPTVIIVGSDSRGCLYGVGAFLREIDLRRPGQVGIPYLRLSDAPAFPFRGSDFKFWQEQRAADLDMEAWSLEQWEEQIAELALWGINLIRRRLLYTWLDTWLDEHEMMVEDGPGLIGWEMEKQINRLIHDYGLQVCVAYPPSTVANSVARDEWHPGSSWPRLACPSLPTARDRILYERLQIFKELEHIDYWFISPYEVGPCECDACQPWAKTCFELARDTVRHLRRYHPHAQIWLSNQGFSPQENEWLLEVLERERPDWLGLIQYDAVLDGSPPFKMQIEVNNQKPGSTWRRYAAMATPTRMLQEMARRVPPDYELVLGPDISHTFQPRYGLEHIDPVLLWLHTYESPFARPLGYYDLFRAGAGVGAGAMLHSEGLYDDLNKALWAGWTWSPNLSPWDAMLAYARLWFGESAARLVSEAILLSETNWELPLLDNDQIEQVTLLLDRAAMQLPPHLQENNWRWTMWRLRGLLDLLAQRKLAVAVETQQSVYGMLSEALNGQTDLFDSVQSACASLDLQKREARLAWLKEEVRDLNRLLHYQIGVRLPAVANVDAELTNLGWDLAQLRQALQAHKARETSDQTELWQVVARCLNYENPGPGGFYDDCGHIGRDPHFVSGHRIPGVHGLDPRNRPSANTFATGFTDAEDVVFAYHDLDPEADYRLRLNLVYPEMELGCVDPSPSPVVMSRACAGQKLYASGFLVHDNLEVPSRVAQQFSFDLPRQAFSDGRLELRFVGTSPGVRVAVSEIWLTVQNK